MQITKPIIAPQLQSVATPLSAAPLPAVTLQTKVLARIRWLFDIDDGAGGLLCVVCVLAVFGTLVVRLVELNHGLNSQTLRCAPVNKTSLQMTCEFQ